MRFNCLMHFNTSIFNLLHSFFTYFISFLNAVEYAFKSDWIEFRLIIFLVVAGCCYMRCLILSFIHFQFFFSSLKLIELDWSHSHLIEFICIYYWYVCCMYIKSSVDIHEFMISFSSSYIIFVIFIVRYHVTDSFRFHYFHFFYFGWLLILIFLP